MEIKTLRSLVLGGRNFVILSSSSTKGGCDFFIITERVAVSQGENVLQLEEPHKFLPSPCHDWKLSN